MRSPGRLYLSSNVTLGGPFATVARVQPSLQSERWQCIPTSSVLLPSSRAPVSTEKTKVCRFAEVDWTRR